MEEIWCSICRGRGSCQRNMPGVSHSRFLASKQWFSDTVQQCRDYEGWASKSSPDVKDLRNVKLRPPFAATSHHVFVSRRNCNRKHLDVVCIGIILYDFSLLFFSRKTVLWYFFKCLMISMCFLYNNHYQMSRQMLSSWCICLISDGEIKGMIAGAITIN